MFELGYIFFQFGFRSIFMHEFDMFSSSKFPKIGPFLQYIVLFDLFDKVAHKPYSCLGNHGSAPYYRPQRSWAKVIFSQACVKNSVHRGGGWLPPWEQTPPKQTPPKSRHPQSRPPWNRPPGSRHPPRADPPMSRHPPGQTPPGTDTPPGADPTGADIPPGTDTTPPPPK